MSNLTKAGLAKALNVSPGRMSQFFKMGMPWPTSVEEAQIWKMENVHPIGDKTGPKAIT